MSRIDKAIQLYQSGVKPWVIKRRLGLSPTQMNEVTQGKDQKRSYKQVNSYLSVLDGDPKYSCIVDGSKFKDPKRNCQKNRYC